MKTILKLTPAFSCGLAIGALIWYEVGYHRGILAEAQSIQDGLNKAVLPAKSPYQEGFDAGYESEARLIGLAMGRLAAQKEHTK